VTHPQLVSLFIQLALMLAAATAIRPVTSRLRLPAVTGELVAGVLLGATLFGTLFPGLSAAIFPADAAIAAGRDAILKLGMVFFLLLAGLEMDLGIVGNGWRRVAWTSIPGIAVPFAAGAATVLLWPGLWHVPPGESPVTLALIVGTALGISALPVIARILVDLGMLNTQIGVLILASAMVNDLIGWSLFAVIVSSVSGGPDRPAALTVALVLGLFLGMLTIGRWGMTKILGWLSDRQAGVGSQVGLIMVFTLLTAAGAEAIGLHAVFGAFLVGAALARERRQRELVFQTLRQLVLIFFAPIYFVSVGLGVNFVAAFDAVLVAIVFIVACVGKLAGVVLGARLSGLSPRESWATAFGMNARGAIEIIFATVAREQGLIDDRIFVALIVMALATSIVSGPAISRLLRNNASGDNQRPATAARAVELSARS
jgi:Kef-type K+ transport system membrane component KefB